VCLGIKHPSGAYNQIFVTVRQLWVCWCEALSLTRGWVCLQLLLAHTSAVILRSEYHGTCVHILLFQIRDFPFHRLLRRAGLQWRYSTPPPHGTVSCLWFLMQCIHSCFPCLEALSAVCTLLWWQWTLLLWQIINIRQMWRRGSKWVTDGSKTAVMDVMGFLYVSLDSSTVQPHDSLGSRSTCTCSETGFSSQNGDLAWRGIAEEQHPVVSFLWAKGLSAKDIHKEMFPVYVGKRLSCKVVPPSWQTFHWWQRGWNTGVKVAETTVEGLLCCGFWHTGKVIGQVYQCWWGYFEK
jgi:hypothetical protein